MRLTARLLLAALLCATLGLAPHAAAQGGADVREEDTSSAAPAAASSSGTTSAGIAESEDDVAAVMHASVGYEGPAIPQRGDTTTLGPTLPASAGKPALEAETFEAPAELRQEDSGPQMKTPYKCRLSRKNRCCDYECNPVLHKEYCAAGPRTGLYVPHWWLEDPGCAAPPHSV